MSCPPRVLITGSGAICAAGRDPDTIWEAVRDGRSALGRITQWDAAGWRCGVAGEIRDFDPRFLVPDRKTHKSLSRSDFFGLYAARRAIESAALMSRCEGYEPVAADRWRERTGVYVASGGGSYRDQYDFLPLLARAGGDLTAFGRDLPQVVHPMWLLRVLPNNVLCHLGITYGFKGPNDCITNHSASSLQAVIEAASVLRTGAADRAVAVGHDAPVEPQRVQYYRSVGLLTEEEVCPFDAARNGCTLGEGAAALVLERSDGVAGRDVPIVGEYLGGACVTEGEGLLPVRPDGDGLGRAIEMALADAGLRSDEVGMVVAHGNATPDGDASEATALRRVFGDSVPPVTACKWAFGHLLAAAGVLDVIIALAALRAGEVPGVATFQGLAPDCAPLPVSRRGQQPRTDVALVLSRGFAGMNAAVIVRGAASV